jgi:sugar phosphate isomerase/epimerase
VQDRLVLEGRRMLRPGIHHVTVSFALVIPYLPAGPAGPLTLPFRADAALEARPPGGVRSPGPAPAATSAAAAAEHPAGTWALSASAFNWTPQIIRAERTAVDIVAGIVEAGIAPTIEIEPGQLWRSFPEPSESDVIAFRERLELGGGAVTIVGGSIDDWAPSGRPRTDEERAAFLVPQLRAAAALGARGVRVPFGQAGPVLLRLLQPVLAELDVVLYEEIQGQQTLDSPANAANLELLTGLDDPRIRVLIDISILMPSLPPTYLTALRGVGAPRDLVDRLRDEWRSPDTHTAVLDALRKGEIPPTAHTLFMNLLVRFGRSSVEDIAPLLPLTEGVHLKFWDLDDTESRVSGPIADIGAALRRTGFTGTLTSEWGGHEWLDDDPATMTRSHLALARTALGESAPALTTNRTDHA